jgi:AcrR family transcriptional regulator
MTDAPLGLRERKKARVRRELIEVSQRLFQEQGYEETTLEQICREVEVAPNTLLRYFESKQLLAVAPIMDGLERFRSELAEGILRGESVVEIWRAHVSTNSRRSGARAARRMLELVYGTPALVAAAHTVMVDYEMVLWRALAEEAGVRPDDDLHSKLLACLLIGANDRTFYDHIDRGFRGDLEARLLAAIDYAVANFPRPKG